MRRGSLGLEQMCNAFWHEYVDAAGHAIDVRALEPRVVRLLLMLLLARMDGKSPVEYLRQPRRDRLRAPICASGDSGPAFQFERSIRAVVCRPEAMEGCAMKIQSIYAYQVYDSRGNSYRRGGDRAGERRARPGHGALGRIHRAI